MKNQCNPEEPTFTEEQEKAIQERIRKDREREHTAIAGDRAYRLGIMACAREVNAGMDDPEVLRVMNAEWERFKTENPILGRKVEQKPAAKE